MKKMIYTCVILFINLLVTAQTAKDYAVMLQASISETPARITLTWGMGTSVPIVSQQLYKKNLKEKLWGDPIALSATDSVYIDTNVQVGVVYEYQLKRTLGTPVAYGYIVSGIKIPEVTYRGNMLLLVEDNYEQALAAEINQLQHDLIGDGWRVLTRYVSRTATPKSVKTLIAALHQTDNLSGLYLLGKVPVPYSGNINPDAHPDHKGAWPADVYYGVMNESFWIDNEVNTTVATSPLQHNTIGDGKFDPDLIYPAQCEMQIGRVYLDEMPAFAENDTLLTQRYLNKAHAFKTASFIPARKSLIDDQFGPMSGEAFAASAWRSYSTITGDSVVARDYLPAIRNESYLLAYGCGAGSYTSASGVATTAQLAASDSITTPFHGLFGSYFGDWDKPNNLLRAPLATKGSGGLASYWSGRPHWHLHHTALGWPIGFSTILTQNNVLGSRLTPAENSGYIDMNFPTFVHIGLMGDPSLRMHYIKPVSTITATPTADSMMTTITWTASTDATDGYVVLRSTGIDEPFRLLRTVAAGVTSITDSFPYFGTTVYQVRARKLEQTPSGSYYNLSLGRLDSAVSKNTYNSSSTVSGIMPVFKLYPNPSQGQVTVEWEEGNYPTHIRIFTLMGSELLSQENMGKRAVISLPETVKGLVLVEITCNGQRVIKKLLVN